jgi:hypothetical protein
LIKESLLLRLGKGVELSCTDYGKRRQIALECRTVSGHACIAQLRSLAGVQQDHVLLEQACPRRVAMVERLGGGLWDGLRERRSRQRGGRQQEGTAGQGAEGACIHEGVSEVIVMRSDRWGKGSVSFRCTSSLQHR